MLFRSDDADLITIPSDLADCVMMNIPRDRVLSQLTFDDDIADGGAENAGVENAGVENTEAKTYGKPSIQKSLTVEAPIRMCLIVNGRKSPISGKPNRTDWPGS